MTATPDRDSDEFEEQIAALLKVDPKGLSGKHRRKKKSEKDEAPDED